MSGERFGKNFDSIEPELITRFQSYTWPGNVRELKQTVDRLVILNNGQVLRSGWWGMPRRFQEAVALKHAQSLSVPQVTGYDAANRVAVDSSPALEDTEMEFGNPAGDDISHYLQGAPPNKKDRYKHARKLLERSDNDFG